METILALLLAFPDLPLPDKVPPAVHDALVQIATRLDLSEPNEGWKGYSFRLGIRWCHRTLLELKDCPPLADATNFPPAEWCEYELSRAAVHMARLEALADFWPSRWLDCQEAMHHAGERAAVWRAALEAQRGYVASRRDALRRLRHLIGSEDYYAGRMPPGVPG